jgi:hypothetical protein
MEAPASALEQSRVTVPHVPPPISPGPLGLRYTIRDHRGRVVPLAHASWPDRFRHFSHVGHFVPPVGGTVSTLILLALVMTFVFAIQDAGSRAAAALGGAKSWTLAFNALGLFGPLAVLMLLIAASIFLTASKIWIPAVARSWLAQGECPSCRYTIDTLEPEADGCTVCPECGAGWRVGPPASEPPTSVGAKGR